MKQFFLEFTANDRLSFEVKNNNLNLIALRVIYQAYQKTGKIISDIKGFEPFPAGEWINIIRYDNFKGEAIKDVQKPTPVTFSPFGLHMKESWGKLDNFLFLNKIEESIKKDWLSARNNYGTFTPPPDEVIEIANKNIPKAFNIARYFLYNLDLLLKLRDGQTFVPIPKEREDDYLLEQNTLAANRIDKKALRGELEIVELGEYRAITYKPRE